MPMKARIMNPPRDIGGGWMEGFIGKYTFQAKVYDEPSTFGINDGRVSKLMVWDEVVRQKESNIFTASIINYDRGWDIEPKTDEAKGILETILKLWPNP
jgi:hypothetical protein